MTSTDSNQLPSDNEPQNVDNVQNTQDNSSLNNGNEIEHTTQPADTPQEENQDDQHKEVKVITANGNETTHEETVPSKVPPVSNGNHENGDEQAITIEEAPEEDDSNPERVTGDPTSVGIVDSVKEQNHKSESVDSDDADTAQNTSALIVEIHDEGDISNGDGVYHSAPKVNAVPSPHSDDAQPKTMCLDMDQNDLHVNKAPVQLEWKNIRFDVKVKGKRPWSAKQDKTVLYPMSGYVKPGEILAIMGPSGAGKTSLLNILAQRELNYTGKVRVNGKKLPRSFRNFSAYVEQDDVIHANLTVLQALRYAAFLRLPTFMPIKEKLARVHEVISILGLEKAKHTKVGSPGGEKGISGGERKRLAIAVEILKRPSLLFLDEPTSGMDAKTSLNIMKAIRNLARTGTTVIMTIHQPRSQIFAYFDYLLLLADGKVAYHGVASEVEDYFTDINPTYSLPRGFNIADHIIDLVTRTTGGGKIGDAARTEDQERITAILNYWEKNKQVVHDMEFPLVKHATDLSKLPNYSSTWIIQFMVLLARNINNTFQNKMITVGKLLQQVVIVFFLGTLYFRMGTTKNDVMNRLGLLFFTMLSSVMNSIFAILTAFPAEFKIFRREKNSRAYSTSAYYFAKVLSDLPLQIFFPLFFGATLYWIVGFHPDAGRYFAFLLVLVLTALAGISMGELLSVSMPKAELGLVLAPIVVLVQAIFSGFYISVVDIPPYWIWMYYCSFFSAGFLGLVVNEFDGLAFHCTKEQLIPGTNICSITSGRQVLELYGFDYPYWSVWICVIILLAFIVLFKVLGFVVLLLRTSTLRTTLKRNIRNKKIDRKIKKLHDEQQNNSGEDSNSANS
eukprot:CAMPEP_0117454074 /NCGR_PEP_ID=MMETSP0759-20121206/10598_1 /TAXON_ID=63605 /ORGANISM="Percolomonas cosmopolitus, Strain WS" /LENGTH=844 /DNA_ID=CAMNT_0005247219 /DNA_START=8 /DNA_END=2543 /DNA_ORIENTATION=+